MSNLIMVIQGFLPLWLMFLGHYICDFTLQSDFMAKFKMPYLWSDKFNKNVRNAMWFHVMSAHCATHALAVYLVSNSFLFSVLEFIAHFVIDTAKVNGKLGFKADQFLHLFCKVVWLTMHVVLTW